MLRGALRVVRETRGDVELVSRVSAAAVSTSSSWSADARPPPSWNPSPDYETRSPPACRAVARLVGLSAAAETTEAEIIIKSIGVILTFSKAVVVALWWW